MYIQGKESIFDIVWTDGPFGTVTYGDVFHQNEVEQSIYNFEKADTRCCRRSSTRTRRLPALLEDKLVLPAYEQMVKASHAFNLLDARHACRSPSASASFCACARWRARWPKAYRASREALGFPLLNGRGGWLMSARDLLFELGTEELPPRTLLSLVDRADRGRGQGLDTAGIPHGKVHELRDAAPARRAGREAAPSTSRSPSRAARAAAANSFDAQGAPTQAPSHFAKNCGVAVAELTQLTTDKGAWLHVSRHRARRGHASCSATSSIRHRRAAHRQAHALGRAHRGIRAPGARRRAAVRR
jgi:hypothetical protein